jgi:UDP-N-acetylglucosamine--N-acetylmuramyl-(pentapeptide) pyrophosphoryl-undecaprenol N-acetylglucosamine transferase
MKNKKFIISGGGSGGHIFPAIAIANAIKKILPDAEILFVGANGKMEMEKVPQAGYPIKGLTIAGFQRGSILKNISLPFKLASSLANAFLIIKKFNPAVAIGVGGYASGPLLKIAGLLGIPTVIQEQNAVPGLTNRLLSNKAALICAAYEEIINVYPNKNVVITGNPIRNEIVESKVNSDEAFAYFGLEKNKKTILIIGGSLGAKTFNEAVKENISLIKNSAVQFIWQTGKLYYDNYSPLAKEISNLKCVQFIDKMDYAYNIADVVISRGGAMSIAELAVLGKPSVLVPSPNVTDDQQTKNVEALVNKNAAIMIKDSDAIQSLFPAALALIENEAQQRELSNNIKKLAINNAAERIVQEIFNVIENKNLKD